jgi:hypothetical protein
MIVKILPTPTFRAATRYVLDRDPDLRHAGAHTIGSNMDGERTEELIREFELTAAGNAKVHRPVAHIILRTSPEDRLLSDREWGGIAGDYLERLGYTNTPYLIVKHPEPDQHVHLVASRVRYDHTWVNNSYERTHSRAIVRTLEREHDLVRTERRMHARDRQHEREHDHERAGR